MQTELNATLGALLRPGAAAPRHEDWPALVAAAREHGVLPLLAAAGTRSRWDRELLGDLRPDIAAHAALAFVNERELVRVLDALADAGVTPLLLKGAHLAFTLYEAPELRPRVDTDLLVRESDRTRTTGALYRLGYEPVPQSTGEVAFAQRQFGRVDESSARHTIDLHWRIANPRAFADRFSYDDLACGAVRIARLGGNAIAPDAPHALLLACLHRTAHHHSSRRLLWLYDIHLLALALAEGEWQQAVDRAVARGLAPVVALALSDTREALGTVMPRRCLESLHVHARDADADVLAYLQGDMSQLAAAASDWRRLAGVRDRTRFLREHLFPPADYIRHRYGVTSRLALPFLYTHRIVTGARRWL